MKTMSCGAKFDAAAGGSIELGRNALMGRLRWLEYVAEGEYAPADRAKLLRAFRAAYSALAPLVAKYIDGEQAAA